MLNLYCWFASRLYSLRNEKGATAVEYGIMVALIAVVIIVTVGLLGAELDRLFGDVKDELIAVPSVP